MSVTPPLRARYLAIVQRMLASITVEDDLEYLLDACDADPYFAECFYLEVATYMSQHFPNALLRDPKERKSS